MRRFSLLIIALATITLSGCSPKISGKLSRKYPSLSENAEVAIIDKTSPVPEEALKIGLLEIGPARFTSDAQGSYDNIIKTAMVTARQHGGNIVQILDYLPAGIDCNTARIWANVYYRKDISNLKSITAAPEPTPLAKIEDKYEKFHIIGELPPTLRIAVHGGAGYRLIQLDGAAVSGGSNTDEIPMDNPGSTGGIRPEELEHNRKMKLGYSYGAEATFYFDYYAGIGIKYSNLHSSGKDVITTTTNYVKSDFVLDEQTDISFIGPFFSLRLLDKDYKQSLILNLGAGRVNFKDKELRSGIYTKTIGGNLGGMADINYDYAINKKFAIGANVSYIYGYISRATVFDADGNEFIQDDGTRVGLQHVSANIGLRINLF